MEGFDTGFFFDLRTGETDVQDVWRSVMERDVPAAVSSVTLSSDRTVFIASR